MARKRKTRVRRGVAAHDGQAGKRAQKGKEFREREKERRLEEDAIEVDKSWKEEKVEVEVDKWEEEGIEVEEAVEEKVYMNQKVAEAEKGKQGIEKKKTDSDNSKKMGRLGRIRSRLSSWLSSLAEEIFVIPAAVPGSELEQMEILLQFGG